MAYVKREDIYRLHVCAWAYGWSKEELLYEIRKFISYLQFEELFKQQEETENLIKNLVLEIDEKNISELKELNIHEPKKNRGYGNKYIKRKFR